MVSTVDIRPSPISGRWYPGEPHQLSESVDRYMDQARLPVIDGEILGVMAPHAGHLYSGPVAGYAFAAVRGFSPELVAVVSPMHHPYSPALLTTAHTAYCTPLGEVPVAKAAVQELDERLKEKLGIHMTAIRSDPEHSLEIELPFLQRALSASFQLLPVMVREQSASVARALGTALAEILAGKNALLVASTDLSHFYPASTAKILDMEIMRRVEAFDPLKLLEAEQQGVGFACGKGALAAVMWAAKELGADKAQLLHYANSGDITGDYSGVVGYGSAVFIRRSKK